MLSVYTALEESSMLPLSLEELPRLSSQSFSCERIILYESIMIIWGNLTDGYESARSGVETNRAT